MVILHYAGITNNKASGVSVVVPQIVNYQSISEDVALYNYGDEHIILAESAVFINNIMDDYHGFPEPFCNPDLVIFHSPFGIPNMVRITRKLVRDKIPYIIVPHGCFSSASMNKKRFKKALAVATVWRFSLRNASAIQYLSQNEFESSIVKGRGIIVPNGIEIPDYTKPNTPDLQNIVYVGRKDIYQKGLDEFIKACGIIRQELEDRHIRISIYGPGSEDQEKQIKTLIEQNGLNNTVFSLPAVYGNEKISILQKADAFFLTSKSEGQPVAVLEAMTFSLPVLVTPGTGFYEDVKKYNCGVAVNLSISSISEGLLYMIENTEEMKKAGKNALEYVKNTYAWEMVTNKALTTYQGIIYEKNSKQ